MPARDPYFVTEPPQTRARRPTSRLDNSHGLAVAARRHDDLGAREIAAFSRAIAARVQPRRSRCSNSTFVRPSRASVEDIRAVSAAAQPHFDDSGVAALAREVPHARRERRFDKGRPPNPTPSRPRDASSH